MRMRQGRPTLELALPVAPPQGRPLGVLLLGTDPAASPFRIVETWPVPRRTAESVVVHKRENEVVYLSRMRGRDHGPFTETRPLSDPRWATVQAALGRLTGEAVDYRGVRVLFAAHDVEDSPWMVVAKIDEEEVVGPAMERGAIAAVLAVGLVAAAAIGMTLWLRQRADLARRAEEDRIAVERARLDAELRRRDEQHRKVVENVPLVQFALDADGVFTLSEGKGLEVLGLRPGEVVGRSVYDVYREYPQITADARRALAGETLTSLARLGPLGFECHWAPVRDEAGRVAGVSGVAIDVSKRLRAEEQLLQAQKMEAVGRLASGIAHDFNNLLVVILAGCDFLLQGQEPGSELRTEVEHIRAAGQRAANLVSQLLTFGRRGRANPVVCQLNAAVTRIEKLIRRTIGEDIEVQVDLAPDLWPVELDPTQLDQVLMNLAVNARDAMPGGGWLRIETRNLETRGEPGAAGDPPPGRWACLAVSDGGSGMSPEVRARVFEPFFTTKEGGKGTGLGLSMVFGIVQQAGGHIAVESEPGRGTTFRLWFPAAADGSRAEEAPPSRAGEVARGETVLLVEDDAQVRRSVARMLEGIGFRVVQASDGPEALARAEEGKVDLVLTDVVMPGMLGTELAERLRARWPELPVAFQSGYTDAETHRLPPGARLLRKPFTEEALRELVAGMLSRPSAAAVG
jgi:PAS domain S-box-containing protein